MAIVVTDEHMEEMHDLITEIEHRQNYQERDIRNLMNLIHVVKGDGVRFPEYSTPYSTRKKVTS